jgi:hypothetical protein
MLFSTPFRAGAARFVFIETYRRFGASGAWRMRYGEGTIEESEAPVDSLKS